MRRQQRRETYLLDGGFGNSYWPFIVAFAVHVMAAVLIAILPSMTIERKPEQIVTINLVDIPAPPSSGAAGSPPPKAEKQPPPPEPTKIEVKPIKEKPEPLPEPEPPKKIEAKPIKEKPEPVPEPPPQVVSLKPQQRVKKMPLPEPPKPEVARPKQDVRRELEKIREQLTKEQQQRELNKARKEEQEAKAEAEKWMAELTKLNEQSRIMDARERGLGSGPASSGADSALMQQYYASIVAQLQSCWKLPDYRQWSPSLLATVIVTVDKSGKILDVQFEKRSGDDAFDRLVQKTLNECANPLPSIPPALRKERLEFGCKFNPGGASR